MAKFKNLSSSRERCKRFISLGIFFILSFLGFVTLILLMK